MLHDPRHDKTPTLAGFALWVATQPPDEDYDWRFCEMCPFGLYLKSIDKYEWWWTKNEKYSEMNMLARGPGLLHPKLWTYGALADRILAHQKEQKAA